MFLHRGTTISWKSYKQTLIDTSTNHHKIIALYKTARECACIRRVINHIQFSCGIEPIRSPVIIYKDSVASLLRYSQVMWKVILLNILFLNFSTHMNFKLMWRLASCKSSYVIIWLIYSLSLCHTTYFLNVLLVLVCVDLEIYKIYRKLYHKAIWQLNITLYFFSHVSFVLKFFS
jgi:hypothetical protein